MKPRLALPGLLMLALALPAVPTAAAPLVCVPIEQLDGRCPGWSSAYDGGSHDGVYAMTVSPDGTTVYSTGVTQTDDGFRALVAAYDAASGEQRWATTDGRQGDEYDSAYDVTTSPDGGTVYVAGAVCGVLTDGSTCDALVAAHDAKTGTRLWQVLRDGEGNGLDSVHSVVAAPGGDLVFAAGQTLTQDTDVDYLAAAFDAGTGEEAWASTYDGPAHGLDRAAELALAGDAIVLTGNSPGEDGDPADIATVAFSTGEDDEGEILWAARYDGPTGTGMDEATGIDSDADGRRVVVAGQSQRGALPSADPTVIAYDARSGEREWVARYDDPGIAGGMLFDVAITPDGESVVATGFTQRSNGKGPTTLAYRGEDGTRLWVANLDNGLGNAATTSPDGTRAYVTGSMTSPRGTLHRTVSYSFQTGAQRWFATYEEGAPPAGTNSTLLLPSAIAMAPDGTHVYVGGGTRELAGDHDLALTLSYQA